MDAVWLQGNVGEALAAGLTEVAVKQPGDPIEHLAYWLLAHSDNLKEREKKFQETALLERERAEKAHEEEQARLMREEEVRVLKRQAMERARRMEAERRAVHVARLDAYEELKAAVAADVETRTKKVFVAADDSMEDDDVEDVALTEVEKAAALAAFAGHALRAVAGLSTYVPPQAVAASGSFPVADAVAADASDDESDDESDATSGGGRVPGVAVDAASDASAASGGNGSEAASAVSGASEAGEPAFEDRLPNMVAPDGTTALDLFRKQVTAEWTAETNPALFQVVEGVMLMLGFTKASATSPEKIAELVLRDAPSVVDLMLRVDFADLPKPTKLKRVADATTGIDVRSLTSASPIGSLPAYVMFKWLEAGFALRNAVVNERLDAGDPLDEIEDQTFRVGEPGEPPVADDDYDSASDWMDLYADDEGGESATSYDDGGDAVEYSASGSYYADSDYDY